MVHGLSAFLRLLPVPAVRAAGAMLGRFVYIVDGFHRRIALTNIGLALPS
jgi:lauroyl/myristoyl acyltransferase